ncbi:phage tail protein [uncultured Bartonella sp.]|uniref:phage tail-collar fiber domain-containing protein n=1 Tax=uncultured Bartonella sp. TaxID=104108 RepID=UPI0025E56EB6|nr:phage tail protein [uncultured Bartonella sp.]
MTQSTFALLTTTGRAKEALALASGEPLVISAIAIGDGTTVPSGGEKKLYHEIARKTVSGHGLVAGTTNTAYFDIHLAATDGPYTIREAGLYDTAGDLIAIACYDPPINKPTPESGQTVEGDVRLQIAFSNAENVIVQVDASMQVPLQRLTVKPWVPVKAIDTKQPPENPVPGDVYVIPATASGVWKGQSQRLAEFTSAGWAITDTPDGHGIGLPDGRLFIRVNNQYVEAKATTERAGFVELATIDEATAKKDDQRAVTPLGLATVISKIGYTTLVFKDVGTTTWTVPSGVHVVDVIVWGAGGGGGGSYRAGASGGAGGGYIDCKGLQVTPGQQILITVGAGGNGGSAIPTNGGSGGASSFGSYATAYGGGGGYAANGAITLKRAIGGNAVGSGLVVPGQSGQTSIVIGDNYFMGGQGGGTYGTTNSIVSTSIRGPNGAYPGGGGCGDPNGFGGGDGANGLVVVSFIKEQSA